MRYAKIVFILLVMMAAPFLPPPANVWAEKSDNLIRVGLSGIAPRIEFRVETGAYALMDSATNLPIVQPKPGQLWSIIKSGPNLKVALNGREQKLPFDGPVILRAVDEGLHLYTYNGTKYRGDLIVENRADGVMPINVLPMEQYLYGVVGQEMGNSAPLEALKAQAVVSRSYAMSLKNSLGSFDVGIDTGTQVYRGYNAETQANGDRVVAAVDATRGQIVVYDGKVIRAFFHSNAGGYTESSENVWVEPLPYLKAVPSPYDIYAAQYENQTNGWPSVSYSWQKGITREELYSQVSRWNKKAENNDSLNLINVGSISDIKLSRIDRNGDKDTASGRVTELTLIGDQGQASVYRDGIRTLLGLRSTLFNISFDSTVTVLNGRGDQGRINSLDGSYSAGYDGRTTLVNKGEKDVFLQSRSANRQIPKKFSKVVIEGNGYGHGLGMSQWGARGMAKDGYKYDKIIQHYYNQGLDNGNLSIETIY